MLEVYREAQSNPSPQKEMKPKRRNHKIYTASVSQSYIHFH